MKLPEINLYLIAPEIILTVFGFLVLLLDVFSAKEGKKGYLGILSLIGVVIAFFFTLPLMGSTQTGFEGMFISDGFTLFFKVLFLIIAFLTLLISMGYAHREGIELGEYYALILFATLGMMLMAAGSHLITIFLGLETMSISIYILAGIIQEDRRSTEAALKYFLLGAFATGFLLYGMALIYGATGSFYLKEVASYIASKNLLRNPMLLMSLVFLTIGFGFKIAAVPFHMWTPDVYEGAPTSITAFMATGVKAAGLRLWSGSFSPPCQPSVRIGHDHVGDCPGNDDPREHHRHLPDQYQTDAGLFEHRPCGLYLGRFCCRE